MRVQKTMRAMDLGAELGAKIYVFWGGREGAETDACRRPGRGHQAAARGGELPVRVLASIAEYGFRFALEAKPNEPRGDIYMATTGAYLGFIPTLDHPEMVGVNPEVAHEQMAGLNFLHAVAQAWEAGKLFHIDLNDQVPGRYDQDFRFGSANVKSAFLLVKFLEDVGYDGPRHFDAHAYRTEDYDGVKDFARGCMRTYLILRETRPAMERRRGDPGAAGRDGRQWPWEQHRPRRAAGADDLLDVAPHRAARHDVRSRRPGRARAGLRAARSTDDRRPARSALTCRCEPSSHTS